jgi:hypothetical protein
VEFQRDRNTWPANHLVESFDFQIIGLIRGRNETVFEIDPRIEVRHVMDVRPYGPDGRFALQGPPRSARTT